MTLEQKLMQALGEMQFQNIVLAHELEAAQARIQELSAAAEEAATPRAQQHEADHPPQSDD